MKKLFSVQKETEFNPEEEKKQFIDIWNAYIKRDGADALLKYLMKSDFFDAPASTKYHNNVRGGLCHHTLSVFNTLLCELQTAGYGMDEKMLESATISAFCHDLCKVSFYKLGKRKYKREYPDGSSQWVDIPNYTIDEELPFGHGEKSVYLVQSFMNLTREEALAIRWHMGDFTEAYGSCAKAYAMCPLALYLHIADLKSSSLKECTYSYETDCWIEE